MSSYVFRKPNRPVTRVFIHCSASDLPEHDNVATVDLWHKQRGWAGVGYHLFIRKSGLVETGRDLEITPAAQAPHNAKTIAICLHGLASAKFTHEQLNALAGLCHQINEAYDGRVTFHGHREVANKACPVIDYRSILGLRNGGVLPRSRDMAYGIKIETPYLDATTTLEEPDVRRHGALRIGDAGGGVADLQKKLSALGYNVGKIDGHFGNMTRAAVLAFQADNHLVADGVFGPASREALADAKPRQVTGERASATVIDLAADGSRIAQASLNNTGAGLLLAGGGALKVLDDASGVVSQATNSLGVFKTALSALGPFLGGAVVVVGAYVIWQSWRAARARVEDHRKGRTA